ncbi:MAG TPA: aspartoacylase [Planctomycetaceae bacterium]|nr:aspartoacylase [Planctomycetaceae bacterium]
MTIQNVAVVGGTHGNELTGIYLLNRWGKYPEKIERSSFSTNLFVGNPKAIEQNRRFIDEDLNRCFTLASLKSNEKATYESLRASYLNQIIGPKGASAHDVVFDMHTSTSNCGVMLILMDDNKFNLRLAAYIQSQMPEAKIYFIPPSQTDQPYLNSICANSLAVEIGPIPQGVLRSDVTALTEGVVYHGLDYIQSLNMNMEPPIPASVEVFEFKESVSFPMTDGVVSGYIHHSLQDSDYQALGAGDPLFECLDGSVIRYDGPETVYPVFVNEAAYYYKNLAMSLCVKKSLRTD